MARSVTAVSSRAATTLMAEISVRAALLPSVSISQAALRQSSRACSISSRDSAAQPPMTPWLASGPPKAWRVSARSTMSSRVRSALPIRRMQCWVRPGHPEAGPDPPLEEWSQPLLLLSRGAVQREQLHVAGVRRSAVGRLRRQLDAAPHDLGQRRVLEVGEPGAEPPVGQEEVPEAPAARLHLQLLDHRRQPVRVL